MKKLSFLLLTILFSYSIKASHIAGGEITYTSLGNNQFRIHLNLFVDCAGFNPGNSQTINFRSTCGGTTSAQVQITPNTTGGLEISQLCPNDMPNSRCNGGNLPGMWLFSYEGTVTLAPPCDTWTMSWSTCCRNFAITNLNSAGSASYYIEATLNSVTAPTNSSPKFNAQPIPYVCVNQPVTYSYGVTEQDGDSLRYQLIPALTTASNVQATYNNPFSGTSPIQGIVINPLTGLITFTPPNIGNYVVVIRVTEFDRATKRVKGTVMRDIQFVVLNCANIVPTPNAGTITNLTGATQVGSYDIDMCPNTSFSFDAVFTDANANDVLTFTSNIATALPGATISKVGTSNNPLTLNVTWTAPPSSQGQNPTFTITISDGACPIEGRQTYVYYVRILHSTTTRPDTATCGPKPVQLTATGGNVFTWSVISGDPISPDNFSCNPCVNPIATPSITTSYVVTSDLSATCKNKDTVTITINPQPVASFITNPTMPNALEPTVHFIDNSSGQVNNWTWNFGDFGASSQSNPTITYPSDTGTYAVQLIVSNQFGCIDTVDGKVTIHPFFAFYAPNAFTPNNNGLNDAFMVKGDGIDNSTFEMLIYNRWGELIFKSNNLNYGWNGTKNNSGKNLDSDVYVWKVKFNTYTGEEKNYIGHVTLLK